MIPDDEGLLHTAILLCAPVCLRVQVQGWLGHEVLVQGGEIRKYNFCADDLSGGRSHLSGSELPLPEASPAGGGEAALQPIIALAARQPKEQSRITAEGDGRLNIAALSFLGVGIQPPMAEWGSMVRENAALINMGNITPLIPAAAIAFLAIAVNFVVDWQLNKASGLNEEG